MSEAKYPEAAGCVQTTGSYLEGSQLTDHYCSVSLVLLGKLLQLQGMGNKAFR